jgi:hypothetical protein
MLIINKYNRYKSSLELTYKLIIWGNERYIFIIITKEHKASKNNFSDIIEVF